METSVRPGREDVSQLVSRQPEGAQAVGDIDPVGASKGFDEPIGVLPTAGYPVMLANHPGDFRRPTGFFDPFKVLAGKAHGGFQVVERAVGPNAKVMKGGSNDQGLAGARVPVTEATKE